MALQNCEECGIEYVRCDMMIETPEGAIRWICDECYEKIFAKSHEKQCDEHDEKG